MAKAKADVPGKVEVFIPRAGLSDETTYFVGVNGVNYILPRGKKSLVPDYVAEEIKRAMAAEEAMYEEQAALLELAK